MAEISSRGTNKWLVRVFLGRSEDGKKRHHSKVVHGNKKVAQKYALSIETKRDLGTLEKPVTLVTHRVMVESLNNMVEASFENPVLEGVLLVLYRSLERLRRKLARETLDYRPSDTVPRLSDLKPLLVLILP